MQFRKSAVAFLALVLWPLAWGWGDQGPRYPFPQHVDYGEGTILPNRWSRAMLDDDVKAFYDYWKSQYLVEVGAEEDSQMPVYRIAAARPGDDQHAVTVSEGQGYGMIIVALMAGYETEARNLFEGLWRFVKLHPSRIDSRLMAWRITAGEEQPEEDRDSAFDGDADIALALYMASRQWGNDGETDYAAKAAKLSAALLESTVGPRSLLPMLGDWVDPNGDGYNQFTNRTSDFMPVNFDVFARLGGDDVWRQTAGRCRLLIRFLQVVYSPEAGLVPDFMVPMATTWLIPTPAPPYFLEGPNDGRYDYNACRVPLRMGMDALLSGNPLSRRIVTAMSLWAEQHHQGDPGQIHAGYTLSGRAVAGSDYFSTAFVAPLGVAAMNVPEQQEWLNRIYDRVRNVHDDYYEDSLTLLSLLVMSGNWWSPAR